MKKKQGSRLQRPMKPVKSAIAVHLPVEEGVQYTVRNIPAKADEALRRRAAELHLSLNEVLRQAILKEAGLGAEPGRLYHDLDHLAGTWVEDPAIDAIIEAQDRVDEDLWK